MVKPRLSPEERFVAFDAANPVIFDLFRQFAAEAKRAGRERFSADAILHRIQWFVDVETVGDNFKCNNDFAAYYARKLIAEDASFRGFFELRTTRTEREIAAAQSTGRLF